MLAKITTAMFAFVVVASAGLGPVHAQTEQDCTAAIDRLSERLLTVNQEAQRNEAQQLQVQAEQASADGEYARCLELIEDAEEAIGG